MVFAMERSGGGMCLLRHRAMLGRSLRRIRKLRGLTQEDFERFSSRTYISTVERGLKNPTLLKVEKFADALHVHPLTLIVLAYCDNDGLGIDECLDRIVQEVKSLKQPRC